MTTATEQLQKDLDRHIVPHGEYVDQIRERWAANGEIAAHEVTILCDEIAQLRGLGGTLFRRFNEAHTVLCFCINLLDPASPLAGDKGENAELDAISEELTGLIAASKLASK